MARLPLDLRKFKKLSNDPHSTTLVHPDGHQITVAHKALSKKMIQDLSAIPGVAKMAEGGDVKQPTFNGTLANQGKDPRQKKQANQGAKEDIVKASKESGDSLYEAGKKILGFADGGEVPEEKKPLEIEAMPAPAAVMSQVPASDAPPSPIPSETPSPMASGVSGTFELPGDAPNSTPAPQPVAQQAPSDPFGTIAYGENYTKGIGEQKAGIFGEANALAQQGKAEASVLESQAKQQQLLAKHYQDKSTALEAERQALQKDYADQKIDINRYVGSLSTPQKIGTAIGLLVSGAFGGMTGQENIVLKHIDNQIGRDIEAQRAEMGKKESLLSANLKQFGNLRDATEMTRVMMNDSVSSQLKAAAAKSQDPMAKARALQAAGKLDADSAPIVSQIAMRQSVLRGGATGQVAPEHIIMAIVPENEKKDAYKELAEAQDMVRARDNILGAFHKLADINTTGNFVKSPIQTQKQVSAIKDPLVAALSKETAGRFTEQDAKFLDSLFPAKGDSEATQALKLRQIQHLITQKMNFPLLKTYGIEPGNTGRFNNTGSSRIQESAPVPNKK